MSVESTRRTIERYLKEWHGDASLLAEDVVFTVMATGQESRGRPAVMATMHHFYHVAFAATANLRVALYGENNAMLEFEFVGKHIGDFAGVPATDKQVRVPMVVVYDLVNDRISRARIYFEIPALLQQLGAPGR